VSGVNALLYLLEETRSTGVDVAGILNSLLGPKKGMQRNVILAHREVRMFILSEI